MKTLVIKQPWASMILDGKKTIETRTWATNYRGQILLCASKKPESPISGYAFATANLVDIVPMSKEHEELACCEVYDKAHAWIFSDIRPIRKFKVKGQLNLFEVEINPEHTCMGNDCGIFLGFRGYCSDKCHHSVNAKEEQTIGEMQAVAKENGFYLIPIKLYSDMVNIIDEARTEIKKLRNKIAELEKDV